MQRVSGRAGERRRTDRRHRLQQGPRQWRLVLSIHRLATVRYSDERRSRKAVRQPRNIARARNGVRSRSGTQTRRVRSRTRDQAHAVVPPPWRRAIPDHRSTFIIYIKTSVQYIVFFDINCNTPFVPDGSRVDRTLWTRTDDAVPWRRVAVVEDRRPGCCFAPFRAPDAPGYRP
jgi:hypothetical protein